LGASVYSPLDGRVDDPQFHAFIAPLRLGWPHVTDAMLYAFDLLKYGGEDLRPFPLSDRKRLLAKVVGRRSLGIVLSQHTDEDIFEGVCRMGLEGVVSKRLSSPYRSGRSTDWLKIKNPDNPATVRRNEGCRRALV
jgi:bifunctional non-homologous end joining protein LigD